MIVNKHLTCGLLFAALILSASTGFGQNLQGIFSKVSLQYDNTWIGHSISITAHSLSFKGIDVSLGPKFFINTGPKYDPSKGSHLRKAYYAEEPANYVGMKFGLSKSFRLINKWRLVIGYNFCYDRLTIWYDNQHIPIIDSNFNIIGYTETFKNGPIKLFQHLLFTGLIYKPLPRIGLSFQLGAGRYRHVGPEVDKKHNTILSEPVGWEPDLLYRVGIEYDLFKKSK